MTIFSCYRKRINHSSWLYCFPIVLSIMTKHNFILFHTWSPDWKMLGNFVCPTHGTFQYGITLLCIHETAYRCSFFLHGIKLLLFTLLSQLHRCLLKTHQIRHPTPATRLLSGHVSTHQPIRRANPSQPRGEDRRVQRYFVSSWVPHSCHHSRRNFTLRRKAVWREKVRSAAGIIELWLTIIHFPLSHKHTFYTHFHSSSSTHKATCVWKSFYKDGLTVDSSTNYPQKKKSTTTHHLTFLACTDFDNISLPSLFQKEIVPEINCFS